MAHDPVTYWGYIKVEELLALQGGLAEDDRKLDNDEVLFITVHQIDELWFKLALRELVVIRDCLAQEPVPEQSLAKLARALRRATMVMHNAAQHFGLMETMTTRDYLAFRDKLSPASGFQSAQLREMEVLLGLADDARVRLGTEGSYLDALRGRGGSESPALRRVLDRIADRPSIVAALDAWLYRTPIFGSRPDDPGDRERVARFIEDFIAAHRREADTMMELALSAATSETEQLRLRERFAAEVDGARHFLLAQDQAQEERTRRSRIRAAVVFIESYRELPLLAWPREVVDNVVALEQAMLVFRQRHARMVERVIGRRTGTGGSAGVDYLDQTALRYRVFSDLWAVRTLLLRREALPAVDDTSFYEFVRGH